MQQDLFASIRIDLLPLYAVLRLRNGGAPGAVAIVDDSHAPGVVFCCSAAAQSHGVSSGMTLSQALGRCHDLHVLSRCPAAESSADRILRNAAWALSPVVEPMAGGGYRLALGGQSIESWQQRATAVLGHLQASGLPGQMGIASTPGIADMAATVASPLLWVKDTTALLRSMTMETAPVEPVLREAFTLWGLHTMEEVRKLPRAELGDRLGPAAVKLWDCLNGRDNRPLQPLEEEVDWGERSEPEYPVETTDSLLFLLRRMLEAIHMRLVARCKAVRQLTLALQFEDRSDYRHRFLLPETTTAVDSLFALLANHLQDLRTPAAITAVHIDCDTIAPIHRQQSFFDTTLRDPARFADTLAQLVGIVGNDRIGSPRMMDSHRDDAWCLAPLANILSTSHRQTQDFALPTTSTPLYYPTLAFRRHRPALPASVVMTNGRPSQLHSSPYCGAIQASRGPWQSSGDWWSAAPWRREEWDVQLADGTLCRLHREHNCWWVDGIYD